MRLGVGSWHPTTRSAPHGAVNFAIALRVGQTMARERDRLRWLVGERRNKRPRITWLFCGPNGSCDNSRQGDSKLRVLFQILHTQADLCITSLRVSDHERVPDSYQEIASRQPFNI